MQAKVRVTVELKPEILDPQGKTIEESLPALGFSGVHGVRVGKYITFAIDGPDAASIETAVQKMCEEFLANPVIEDFTYSVEEAGDEEIK